MGWYGTNDGYVMSMGGMGMMLLWMILQVLFWVAVIYFGVRLVRRAWGSQAEERGAEQASPALTLLEERFVKGEISEEEFRKMKEALRR